MTFHIAGKPFFSTALPEDEEASGKNDCGIFRWRVQLSLMRVKLSEAG